MRLGGIGGFVALKRITTVLRRPASSGPRYCDEKEGRYAVHVSSARRRRRLLAIAAALLLAEDEYV